MRKEFTTALAGGGCSRATSPKPVEPLLPGENPKFPTFSDAVRIRWKNLFIKTVHQKSSNVLMKHEVATLSAGMRRAEADLQWLAGRLKWES